LSSILSLVKGRRAYQRRPTANFVPTEERERV
jgi:hypothetical protein